MPAGEKAGRGPLAGLNKGAMAAFLARPRPLDLGEVSFVDGEGVAKSLSDSRGKVVLLNILATWCGSYGRRWPRSTKQGAAVMISRWWR